MGCVYVCWGGGRRKDHPVPPQSSLHTHTHTIHNTSPKTHHDTQRLLDPKYYGNDRENMLLALAEIMHLGCRFVVGGRVDAAAGAFVTLEVGGGCLLGGWWNGGL